MSRMLTNFLLYSVVKPMITEAIKSSRSEPAQPSPEESKFAKKDGDILLDGDKIFWEGVGNYTHHEKRLEDGKVYKGWFPVNSESSVVDGKTLLVLFTNSKHRLDYKLYENV